MILDDLLAEYDAARRHTQSLITDLDEEAMTWRPHPNSSAIGWHFGHTAAVNHYMVRNLTAAEPSIDAGYDKLFDSATEEPHRGALPPTARTAEYREQIASSTHRVITAIREGTVSAPAQLTLIATGMLTSIVNHEYQHAKWIAEVRADLGHSNVELPPSANVTKIDGYWFLELAGPRSSGPRAVGSGKMTPMRAGDEG